MPAPPPRRRRSHESRVLLLALAGGVPALVFLALALWLGHADPLTRDTALLVAGLVWIACAFLVRETVVRPLHTLSNMLAALREGDYSIRARGAEPRSSVGLALLEVNALADALRRRRTDVLGAEALLRRVLDSVDVAILAFDHEGRLRVVNREAESLLDAPAERTIGRSAESLGLAPALEGETPRLAELRLPGRAGRWEIRRGEYRHEGRPFQLLVLSDLTRALREEEREAWLRLVRVLSHEINNSLAPIQSIAGSLSSLLANPSPPPESLADARQGLQVMENRARSLGRFMSQYAQLARLPKPRLVTVDVGEWVRRVASLETRLAVEVIDGPPLRISADGDQLDQLLINIVQNAADAALGDSLRREGTDRKGGHVRVTWRAVRAAAEVEVTDDGPGLADTANLFVPFFTTKPDGSGIGLALCRQIAEAHGGSVVLENRRDARGCVARVRLPVRVP